jgi:transposase InsO family protein
LGQGSQYQNAQFQRLLRDHGVTCPMIDEPAGSIQVERLNRK